VRASFSFGLLIGSAAALAVTATPAAADYPGSTQPGATPVPPGNLILIRGVPPRNAIIAGAGDALGVPTAPPSSVFATIQGVGSPLTDAQAASVTGSLRPGQVGQYVAGAIDGVLRAQSATGGVPTGDSGASRSGGAVGGALQTGLGALSDALSHIGGQGH
jgi:hypothetical protein